jgi:hypothetical protein
MATEIYSLVGKNSAVITKIQTFQASLLAKAQTMQTTATGKATIAQRLFNLAAKANPYLLLITGIAALIGVFALFSKKVSAAEQAQKDLNKVQEESAKIAQDETAKLNMLMQKATIYNKNNRERLDAIRQINEQYGDYLPKLLTEKSTVKEIMAAYESLTVVIQKQAIIRASMEMISEKTKERIELAMAEVTVQEELRAEQQKYAKIYNEWKKAEKAYNSEREKHTYDQLKLILQLEKKHERNIRRLMKKKKNWQSKGKKTQKK